MSFRWLHVRSSSSRIVRTRRSSAVGTSPSACSQALRVGDAVRHIAGGAGTRGVGEPLVQRLPFGGTLEAAVLVEELRVEVEDAVADEVEAKVARLDDAGVDRADGELVDVVAADRHPALERRVVVDERPQRLVSGEADPLQVVRLALVPAGRGSEIDDRGDDSLLGGNGLQARRPVLDRRAACGRALRPRSRAGRRSVRRRRVPRRPVPGRR